MKNKISHITCIVGSNSHRSYTNSITMLKYFNSCNIPICLIYVQQIVFSYLSVFSYSCWHNNRKINYSDSFENTIGFINTFISIYEIRRRKTKANIKMHSSNKKIVWKRKKFRFWSSDNWILKDINYNLNHWNELAKMIYNVHPCQIRLKVHQTDRKQVLSRKRWGREL